MPDPTAGREPSFEEVLADPMYQSGYDHELLPHLIVERCRCAAVHIGPCSSGRQATATTPCGGCGTPLDKCLLRRPAGAFCCAYCVDHGHYEPVPSGRQTTPREDHRMDTVTITVDRASLRRVLALAESGAQEFQGDTRAEAFAAIRAVEAALVTHER